MVSFDGQAIKEAGGDESKLPEFPSKQVAESDKTRGSRLPLFIINGYYGLAVFWENVSFPCEGPPCKTSRLLQAAGTS
jgi:hypothetical protein